MSWIGLLVAAVRTLSALMHWAGDRGRITNAQKALLADMLVQQAEEVDKGLQARLAQRLRDAGGVPDKSDKFRRD